MQQQKLHSWDAGSTEISGGQIFLHYFDAAARPHQPTSSFPHQVHRLHPRTTQWSEVANLFHFLFIQQIPIQSSKLWQSLNCQARSDRASRKLMQQVSAQSLSHHDAFLVIRSSSAGRQNAKHRLHNIYTRPHYRQSPPPDGNEYFQRVGKRIPAAHNLQLSALLSTLFALAAALLILFKDLLPSLLSQDLTY